MKNCVCAATWRWDESIQTRCSAVKGVASKHRQQAHSSPDVRFSAPGVPQLAGMVPADGSRRFKVRVGGHMPHQTAQSAVVWPASRRCIPVRLFPLRFLHSGVHKTGDLYRE